MEESSARITTWTTTSGFFWEPKRRFSGSSSPGAIKFYANTKIKTMLAQSAISHTSFNNCAIMYKDWAHMKGTLPTAIRSWLPGSLYSSLTHSAETAYNSGTYLSPSSVLITIYEEKYDIFNKRQVCNIAASWYTSSSASEYSSTASLSPWNKKSSIERQKNRGHSHSIFSNTRNSNGS